MKLLNVSVSHNLTLKELRTRKLVVFKSFVKVPEYFDQPNRKNLLNCAHSLSEYQTPIYVTHSNSRLLVSTWELKKRQTFFKL